MAMMDNAGFLLAHIRNSFITSDDTGMCELIIENDETDRESKKVSRLDGSFTDSGAEFSDHELSTSYDILPDMGYGHRLRSNTAQRLERLKKEKKSQRKVKNISWRDCPSDYTAEDKGHLFEKKSLPYPDSDPGELSKASKLSQQIENYASSGENRFLEYAKFDGRASVGTPTKKIDIFLTMCPPGEREYPITVIVVASAKIHDLIGLICWQYTNEGREPKLNENIEMYCLHIAEDDGEVDTDFPSLDNREPVSKFGFSKLALVEKDIPPPANNRSTHVVTVYVPNRGFNKFQVENMNTTIREILQRVLKRRKVKIRPGQQYNIEKQSEPGVSLELDATLASMDTLEFCLVRENSTRGEFEEERDGDVSTIADSLTSHQYKSYIVNMIHRLRTNTEVQLGISGEKIEIDPVGTKGSVKFLRQKAATYLADTIASADIIEDKNGKSVFRLTYFTDKDSYKHHDFEADDDVALEIVQKIKNILEMRLSPVRKDYMATKERKLKKRESLKFS